MLQVRSCFLLSQLFFSFCRSVCVRNRQAAGSVSTCFAGRETYSRQHARACMAARNSGRRDERPRWWAATVAASRCAVVLTLLCAWVWLHEIDSAIQAWYEALCSTWIFQHESFEVGMRGLQAVVLGSKASRSMKPSAAPFVFPGTTCFQLPTCVNQAFVLWVGLSGSACHGAILACVLYKYRLARRGAHSSLRNL